MYSLSAVSLVISLSRSGHAMSCFAVVAASQHGKQIRHDQQGRRSREQQAANHRAAERRVLLATFAQAERHRQHADDHGQGGHEDGANAGAAGLEVVDELAFGLDYARTLAEWHVNFLREQEAVEAQGFDQRFIRTWQFYLAYCEAGFREHNIDLFQFTLRKG